MLCLQQFFASIKCIGDNLIFYLALFQVLHPLLISVMHEEKMQERNHYSLSLTKKMMAVRVMTIAFTNQKRKGD